MRVIITGRKLISISCNQPGALMFNIQELQVSSEPKSIKLSFKQATTSLALRIPKLPINSSRSIFWMRQKPMRCLKTWISNRIVSGSKSNMINHGWCAVMGRGNTLCGGEKTWCCWKGVERVTLTDVTLIKQRPLIGSRWYSESLLGTLSKRCHADQRLSWMSTSQDV